MIKFNVEEKHAEFIFKVLTPVGISFHLVDRYSSMREFQSLVRKDMDSLNFNFLPPFPQKRMFGSLDPKFLKERMDQLNHFFNVFFANSEVAQNRLVMTYFSSKLAD